MNGYNSSFITYIINDLYNNSLNHYDILEPSQFEYIRILLAKYKLLGKSKPFIIAKIRQNEHPRLIPIKENFEPKPKHIIILLKNELVNKINQQFINRIISKSNYRFTNYSTINLDNTYINLSYPGFILDTLPTKDALSSISDTTS